MSGNAKVEAHLFGHKLPKKSLPKLDGWQTKGNLIRSLPITPLLRNDGVCRRPCAAVPPSPSWARNTIEAPELGEEFWNVPPPATHLVLQISTQMPRGGVMGQSS